MATTPEKYTLVYIDQNTGEHFTLTRTPIGTFIEGQGVDGDRAQNILSDIVVDQMLEQIEATA